MEFSAAANVQTLPSRIAARMYFILHSPILVFSCQLVPEAGLEPARPCGHRILSPVRLPLRHSGTPIEGWRLDPELNRGTGICSPLHNHSAIEPYY